MDIENFVSKEIRKSKKAVHGGDVWELFKSGKREILDFSSNVNPLGPPRGAIKAIRDSLWDIPFYPESDSDRLKDAIGDYLKVNKDNLIIGNGSTEIIKIFCDVFLRKGVNVIIVEPTFSEYQVYCGFNGATIKRVYARSESDFAFPHRDLLKNIDSSVRAVFLCSPNNPTGMLVETETLENIIKTSEKNNCLVFLDEAYIEFSDSEGYVNMAVEYDNLLILRSLTKFYSLPGLRIGYGVGNQKLIKILEKGKIPWNVNTLAQAAAIASIKDNAFIKKSKSYIRKERLFMRRELEKLGIKVYGDESNFLLLDFHKYGLKARDIKSKLIEKGILIRDCSSFNGLDEYFVRVSVRKRKENIKLIGELKNLIR